MKTYAPKPRDIERRWYVIDAQGSVLGRLASETAKILRGKDKPTFAPHADTGDHVVIVNASGVELTGGKETKKVAYRHSGYPGGLTETDYGRLMRERPSFVVEKAVKGMLPKNRLGRQMAKKLQVYDGPEHPHAAQQPTPLKLGELPQWNGLPKVEPPKPKPEPKKAPAKSTAKATTAKPTTAKRTTAKSPAKKPSTAKRTGAKRTTAKTTAKSTAKSPAKKPSTAKRTTTRKKKEGDE